MAKIKVRHLVTNPSGNYFQATPAMRKAGIGSRPLSKDLGTAIDEAEALNDEWDRIRRAGDTAEPPAPHGTFAWLVAEMKRSTEWADKAPRTREDIETSVAELMPTFGPAPIKAITPARVDRFYKKLRDGLGLTRSAMVMKWFRYVFNFGIRMHPTVVKDNPTYAVRIKQPPARKVVWQPGTIWRTVLGAWRRGWYGVALVIAVAYDTGLRPQDIRALTPGQIAGRRLTLVLQKTEHIDDEEKSYRLWRSTIRLSERYKAALGVVLPNHLPLIRSASGRPFANRHHLAKQVRTVLREAGLPDTIQLRDLRRTGNKEAAEGGATEAQLAARNHHSIGQSSKILDVYTPKTEALAQSAQEARRRTKTGRKV